MFALGRETASGIASIVTGSYYSERVEYLKEIFIKSRSNEHRNDPKSLLSIQLTIAEFQSEIWKVLREGKSLVKEIEASNNKMRIKEAEQTRKNIVAHEQLLRISKNIADGIAWRTIGYNRMLMDIAARGFGTGAIDVSNPDFQSEFTWTYLISEKFGGIVLVNDLTHSLKIGDLTEVYKNEVFVHEIKRLGKKVNNVFTLSNRSGKDALSKQSKKLLEFQKSAITKSIDVDGQKISAVPLHVPLKTHFLRVENLIKEARSKGYSEVKLESYLKVNAVDFKNLPDISTLPKKDTSKDLIISHSNWDSFYTDSQGNFMRLMVPYSIYPFKNKVCMDLMSGQLLLTSELNLDALKTEFRNKGWGIEDLKEEDLDKSLADFETKKEKLYSGEKLFSSSINTMYYFMIRRGPFSFPIDPALGVRITYEFLTFETLNAIVEKAFQRASKIKKPETYYPSLDGEAKLWN